MSLIRTSILLPLACLIGAPLTSASAQETTSSIPRNNLFPVECATRDLQIVAQLEQYIMNNSVFDHAFSTMIRARRACYDGRVTEGLSLYDSIRVPSFGRSQ
jgi:hypothetical protein